MGKINYYFKGYKSKSNKDSELRWYCHGKSRRLYVSRKLIGQYIQARGRADNDGTVIVEIGKPSEYAIKVNNQAFVSLNRLEDDVFQEVSAKRLVYGTKAKQLINSK